MLGRKLRAWPYGWLVEAAVLSLMLAWRGLMRAGGAVAQELEDGDLRAARCQLGRHLVSRDVSQLDEGLVAAAAIESLAENSSDSVVAPLFWYGLGGLPAALAYRFLNTADAQMGYRDPAREWLGDYLRTYVERDLREVTRVLDLRAFETFVRLAAARTATELNLSGLASDAGITHQTARRWLTALEIGYVATTLPSHHANYRKRLRKRPRLHFLDSGLVCYLLGIGDAATLERHPLRGAVFESFVVAELIKAFAAMRRDAPLFFWRDATGHEIDILIDAGDRLIPVEVRSGQTVPPDAVNGLDWWTSIPANPNRGGVLVHGGTESFDLRGFRVLPWFLERGQGPVVGGRTV